MPQTINYYDQNSQSFSSDTFALDLSDLYRRFLTYVPNGGKILDAGCGSGRDSLRFFEMGYQVWAFDASAAMVEEAKKRTGLMVHQADFFDIKEENHYDGIWACASLLHVKAARQKEVLALLLRALKPGGVLYVSYKLGDQERQKDGRHFTDANETILKSWLTDLPEFGHLKLWQTEDRRPTRTEIWLNGLVFLDKRPTVGKRLNTTVYWHILRNSEQPLYLQTALTNLCTKAGISEDKDFNVIKYNDSSEQFSFLFYPDFFGQAFPELASSTIIHLETGLSKQRTYKGTVNPPILHRKELLLPVNHKDRDQFTALTNFAESLGLFSDPKQIGFKLYWNNLIKKTGYQIIGHDLLPLGNAMESSDEDIPIPNDLNVARHRTALSRSNLSAPVQALARYGFLNGSYSFFDYGCGKGDDVRNLNLNSIIATGWDPHFAPNEERRPADIVNLGFVLNVIENLEERKTALQNAYSLTNRLLAVSVMLYNQNAFSGQEYADGVLTSRQTFQKYFTQVEFKHYLDTTLGVDSIPVGPGILFVFKDEDSEQLFLQARYRSRSVNRLRVENPDRISASASRVALRHVRHEQRMAILSSLQEMWLELGREPDPIEVNDTTVLLAEFGSFKRALNYLRPHLDLEQLLQTQNSRRDDILTYLALQFFARRKPYSSLNLSFQRDIKAFFSSYQQAKLEAENLLFQIGDSEEVQAACNTSSENGLGYLDSEGALLIAASAITTLPAVLRTYVGCAALLYGDTESADLVKIHAKTGKLSLMRYDDFCEKPVPQLLERVKINLKSQKFDYFLYGEEYEPTNLYLKSRYLLPTTHNYLAQREFDQQLESLRLFDFRGYGPRPKTFAAKLEAHRLEISGFQIRDTLSIPELDSPCGRYLRFRDLIQCGETWQNTRIANLPARVETYNALFKLTTRILDPVIEYFGMICLTYGFSSAELSKQIPSRIAPKLDQHACYELNRLGNPICDRLGAACDFYIEDEDMLEVAQWIVEHLPFDRLYFYGADRPIHVSYGPEMTGQIVVMRKQNGRQIPKVIEKTTLVSHRCEDLLR